MRSTYFSTAAIGELPQKNYLPFFQLQIIPYSLQATWILNQITGAIRASNISDSINLPSTSVYQASSISQLSRLVVESIQNSTSSLQSRTRGIMTQQLHSLVVKYTQGFSQRPAILRDPAEVGDVVLATGTTGGLGCHILVQLLLDDAVKAVYAFNRPSGDLRRHEEIFRRNGLDVKWLRSPKLYLVEGTLTEPALGLDNPTYEKVGYVIFMSQHIFISLHRFETRLLMLYITVCIQIQIYTQSQNIKSHSSLESQLQPKRHLVRRSFMGGPCSSRPMHLFATQAMPALPLYKFNGRVQECVVVHHFVLLPILT